MVVQGVTLRVAARVRCPGYTDRHPYEFTIRSRVPSGAETELSKIVNGHGDWLFYGHANASGDGFDIWWLIDLKAFRAALVRRGSHECRLHCGDRKNPDGTWFKWFDVRSFPAEPALVVAAHNSRSPC